MMLSHRIRIVPTKAQEDYFRRACGTSRFVYNWGLVEWERQNAEGLRPNGRLLKKQFNSLRKVDFPWTYDVGRDCTAQPFDDLQFAFQRFFKKQNKLPKFKKKGQRDSFGISNDRIKFAEKRVRLPIVGWIRLRESLRFNGVVMSARVKRKADAWFLIVAVDVDDYQKDRTSDGIVGVDLGIKTSATLSTGEKVQGPKSLQKEHEKLVRLSRQLSRKQKGSKNRAKAAMKLARLHSRISNVRNDSLHKLTTNLCRQNQTVVIEDLNVKGMVKNHRLAKNINDEGWGEFRRQLQYKSEIYNVNLVIADRWFPSSKMCSCCGNVKKKLNLSERVYKCGGCGVTLDRDLNAALNLKQLGVISPEVTPMDKKALDNIRKCLIETGLGEVGTHKTTCVV